MPRGAGKQRTDCARTVKRREQGNATGAPRPPRGVGAVRTAEVKAPLKIEGRGENELARVDDAVGVRCAVGEGADGLEASALLKVADVQLEGGADLVGEVAGAEAEEGVEVGVARS